MKNFMGNEGYFKKISIFYVILMGIFQIADKLYGSAYMLYFNNSGLSVALIGLLLGIQDAVIALVDYPSGVISDFFGRKRTTGLAMIVYGVGMISFALTYNVFILAISLVIIAVGMAMYSGSPQVWYYDEMVRLEKLDYRNKIIPKLGSIIMIFSVIGALIALLLAGFSYRLPLYFAACLLVITGIIVLLVFKDNKGTRVNNSVKDTLILFTKNFVKDKNIKNIVIQEVLSNVGFCVFLLIWQLNIVNEFKLSGRFISIILIVLMLGMSLGYHISSSLSKKFNIITISTIGRVGTAISFLVLFIATDIYTFLIAIVIFEICTGIDGGAKSVWHNDYIESRNRATYYSGISSIKTSIGFFTYWIVGLLIDKAGYHSGWMIALVFQGISILTLILFIRKNTVTKKVSNNKETFSENILMENNDE